MNHIQIKKEILNQDIKFYKYMMRYNVIAIIFFCIGITLVSFLIYIHQSTITLHILLGSQIASIIFMLSLYQKVKIDYKNSLYYLSLIESSDDMETAKICELKYRINQLEGVIDEQKSINQILSSNYQSLLAANRETSSMDRSASGSASTVA